MSMRGRNMMAAATAATSAAGTSSAAARVRRQSSSAELGISLSPVVFETPVFVVTSEIA